MIRRGNKDILQAGSQTGKDGRRLLPGSDPIIRVRSCGPFEAGTFSRCAGR